MIEQNRKEFEIGGLLHWLELGYTGKGNKIAETEAANPILSIFNGKLHDPFGIGKDAPINGHGQKVLDVIHQGQPDAELYTLPNGGRYGSAYATGAFLEQTLPFAIKEGIDFIAASLEGIRNAILEAEILKAQKTGIIFTCSAGNAGARGLNDNSKSNTRISVAALGYNDNLKKIFLKNYSSQGQELDYADFSGQYVYDAKRLDRVMPMEGTSFSSPHFTCKLSAVQQFFKEKTGGKLNQDQMYKFVQDHVKDLGDIGFDELYGWGLFVLPEPSKIDIKKYITTPVIVPVAPKMTVSDAIDIWATKGIIGDPAGMKQDFATGKFRPDRYSAFLIKSAEHINGRL
jgi:subtilisin family serine protease